MDQRALLEAVAVHAAVHERHEVLRAGDPLRAGWVALLVLALLVSVSTGWRIATLGEGHTLARWVDALALPAVRRRVPAHPGRPV